MKSIRSICAGGCGVGFRARRDRWLVDLGSLLRHRGIETEGPAAADRPEGDGPEQLLLVNRDFLAKHADVVGEINEEVAKATAWAGEHRDEAATLFSEASGVDIVAQKRSVDRAEFSFGPMTDAVIAQQQSVADRFQRLGLIPAPINVRDIVWFWKPNA